jgi:hypothetical protein
MPRCIICDYTNDISGQGPKREVNYNAQEKGFVCSHCDTAIDDALFEFDRSDEEESELVGPEVLEWGELPLLEEEDGPSRHRKHKPDRSEF